MHIITYVYSFFLLNLGGCSSEPNDRAVFEEMNEKKESNLSSFF